LVLEGCGSEVDGHIEPRTSDTFGKRRESARGYIGERLSERGARALTIPGSLRAVCRTRTSRKRGGEGGEGHAPAQVDREILWNPRAVHAAHPSGHARFGSRLALASVRGPRILCRARKGRRALASASARAVDLVENVDDEVRRVLDFNA